jgi:alanyl-tRNA synthetase
MKVGEKIKKQIIEEASAHPDKYFPVKTLEKLGLKRQKCSNCSVMFWSAPKRDVCGDTTCVKTYTFIGETPAKKSMEFVETYTLFKEFLSKRGYTPIDRFPIVARWRDDLDFNIASIIGFQPYVTKGIVAPPAELVILPQNCLRFGDIDNVGYTGRHGSNFVMIGQLAFKKPKEYDQGKYVKDLFEWFTDIMKIPKEELQIHEDAWIGGGDCGPSMEFFSRGLELGNQVYMWYDMSEAEDISELKELDIKVLDMGMGLERCCWFSKGSVNQYDATMPRVCKFLFEKTKLKPNWKLYEKFLPYSGNLNMDEIENIDDAWADVANHIGNISVEELRSEIDPLAGLYSLADHSKTLLYALSDGALPSNVKGGYNLRLVLRRALDFIYKYNWDVDLFELIEMQAEDVKGLYPEFVKELPGIKKIIEHEIKKFHEHKEKIKNTVSNLVKKNKQLNSNDFVKLYISEGITPEDIKKGYEDNKQSISIPANFFTLVNEFFESQKEATGKAKKNVLLEHIEGLPETELLYYQDSFQEKGDVKILKEFEVDKKKYIVLDRTLFYPTGGGQACDLGSIGEKQVINVIKVGSVVLHEVK